MELGTRPSEVCLERNGVLSLSASHKLLKVKRRWCVAKRWGLNAGTSGDGNKGTLMKLTNVVHRVLQRKAKLRRRGSTRS